METQKEKREKGRSRSRSKKREKKSGDKPAGFILTPTMVRNGYE